MADNPKSTFAKRVRAAKPRAKKYDVWNDAKAAAGAVRHARCSADEGSDAAWRSTPVTTRPAMGQLSRNG